MTKKRRHSAKLDRQEQNLRNMMEDYLAALDRAAPDEARATRPVTKILTACNGLAACKFMRSVRRWEQMELPDQRCFF